MTTLPEVVLIRASAGTGKTYELVRRYLTAISEKEPQKSLDSTAKESSVDCRNLVMLTFARNAAAEMRERIHTAVEAEMARAKPEDVPSYWRLLRRLAGAPITTIHAFAQRLLMENALLAGVPPNFRVLEEKESGMFCHDAALKTVLACLDATDANSRLVAELCRSHGVNNIVKELVKFVFCLRRQGIDLARNKVTPPAPTSLHITTRQNLSALAGSADELADIPSEHALAEPYLQAVIEIAVKISDSYAQHKHFENALDFDDLLFRALHLAEHYPAIASNIAGIMIDEAQDNSPLQNRLIRTVFANMAKPPRLFVVCGDWKQTIHVWRGADEQSLDHLTTNLPTSLKQHQLQENHRSQRALLEWVNQIMPTEKIFGQKYSLQEYLQPCAAARQTSGPNVELLLPDWEYAGNPTEQVTVPLRKPIKVYRFELRTADIAKLAASGQPEWQKYQEALAQKIPLEARAIAARIKLLCDENADASWRPPYIWNAATRNWENTGKRTYRYGDIAILLRAATHQGEYEAALRAYGIPYTSGGKGRGFFERSVVRDLTALLSWLAAPDDYSALLTILRSPFIGLSDDAITILACADDQNEKLAQLAQAMTADVKTTETFAALLAPEDQPVYRRAVTLLAHLRQLVGHLPAVDLAREAINLTGLDATAAGATAGVYHLANLRKCLSMIHNFEQQTGADLPETARWLKQTGAESSEPDAAVSAAEDAVRICTVHAAKGLTFPVVFLPDLRQTQRNATDLFQVASNSHLDTAPSTWRLAVKISLPNIDKKVASQEWQDLEEEQKRRQKDESRRLFYVAITRARDLLVLSGENSKEKPDSTNATSWRNWINAYLRQRLEEKTDFSSLMRLRTYSEVTQSAKAPTNGTATEIPEPAQFAAAAAQASRRHAQSSTLRMPVTFLAQLLAGKNNTEPEEMELLLPSGITPENAADRLAAQAGNIKHIVLEHIDYHQSAAEQARRYFTNLAPHSPSETVEETVAAAEWLQKHLAGAKEIIRELPFAARFNFGEIQLIIDGKIDLLYQSDGRWHLLDYKFSHADPARLTARYAPQLWLYHAALAADKASQAPWQGQANTLALELLAVHGRQIRLIKIPNTPSSAELNEKIRHSIDAFISHAAAWEYGRRA